MAEVVDAETSVDRAGGTKEGLDDRGDERSGAAAEVPDGPATDKLTVRCGYS